MALPPPVTNDVSDNIGGTPLVRLNRLPQSLGVKATVLAKLEYLNPGGSIKDRIAKRMLEKAEHDGLIKPGDTLIEASSGNTGTAIALLAAIKGYKCIITLSEKMSFEKERVLQCLGARVVRTPAGVPIDSPDSIINVAKRLQKDTPNSWILDQYNNDQNPAAHEFGTAEEIWQQTGGRVDAVVAGAGTGGTVTGLSRGLKKHSSDIIVVGVDPVGSVLAQPPELNDLKAEYHVEGIGYDFLPSVLDQASAGLWVKTGDAESFRLARRLACEEGLLVGGSSGAAVAGLSHLIAQRPDLNEEGKVIVLILPDTLRSYLTKFSDDQWMESRGFNAPEPTADYDLKQSRLVTHFIGRPLEAHASGWSELWESGRADLWDRGFPSRPLLELITEHPDLLPAKRHCGRNNKVLVPGCGTGYDPVMLALHGFDAVGLEISSTAVAAAETYASSQMKDPLPYHFGEEEPKENRPTPGEVVFLEGDYFTKTWERRQAETIEQFNAVYDYTFLCALPPEMRKAWADRARELLRPGGLLICLEFPLWKDRSLPGPPWGLKGVYWNLLAEGGDGINFDENLEDTTSGQEFLKGGFVRIYHAKPRMSYQQGRGIDMLSVWQKKAV